MRQLMFRPSIFYCPEYLKCTFCTIFVFALCSVYESLIHSTRNDMKNMPVIITVAILVIGIGAWALISMGSDQEEATNTTSTTTTSNQEVTNTTPMQEKNIVQTAIDAGSFTTLVKAIQAAGLVDTLSGPGPFTVFAPTDAAFAKLPAGTLESLLADKEKLAKILTYHVVSGNVMAADVVKLTSAKTVQGQTVTIDTSNGVMVNNAKVTSTDIMTSNGVIHVIDTVLLPQ